MSLQEYISSGIVESYVLGLASPEDAAEFESLCSLHREVRVAREAFELQLEQAAIANGVTPPRQLKSQIFSEIEIESEKAGQRKPGMEVPFEEPVSDARTGWWKIAAAASIVLFITSAILNFYFYNRYNKYKSEYSGLLASQAQTASNYEAKIAAYQHTMDVMKDTAMAIVKMKGMPSHESSVATVFWDTKTRDVYVMLNNHPPPAAGKQYQLWAQVGDKMVDAGLIDWSQGGTLAIMKKIPEASAFAISLENEGGSKEPNLQAVYVLGKV